MREILFRGQRCRDKTWAVGSLITWPDSGTEICIPKPGRENEMTKTTVYPETVGQFTGLTDKNGKKIFEGDIISADNGKQASVAVVKFGEYYPAMFYRMLDIFIPGKSHLPAHGFFAETVDKKEEIILFQSPYVTVIGNIHDNPELLEVTDNA